MLTPQDLQTFLIFGIIVLCVLFLFVSSRRRSNAQEEGTPPQRWADKEAMSVINRGIKRAESVLSAAESEGMEIVESTKVGMRSFEQEHNEKFEATLEEAEKQLRLTLEEGIQEYKNLLTELQKESKDLHVQAQKTMKDHIEETLRAFDKNISQYYAEVEKRGLETIEQEKASARNAIEEYKQQRLHAVDAHIVEILEQTTRMVLKDTLKLEDHMDLIFDALERAKAENLFM